MLDLPDFSLCGWYETEYGLKPVTMTHPCAAPELLKDVVCDCQPSKCSTHCCCLQNNQPCTDDCSCKEKIAITGVLDDEDDDNDTAVYCMKPKNYGVNISHR